MHPHPAHKSCRIPEGTVPADNQYLKCHGYVDSPQSMGAAENVEYFEDLALRHLRSAECRRRVLAWLASVSHKELLLGFKVGWAA